MTPAYIAAEYFIDVLGKTSTFCTSYHSINSLIQQANKEVAAYFKTEGQSDIFCIFKKFPDVFILTGSTVTLTDAFLSLFAFPQSAEFSSNEKSENIFETAAIEYFKLILIRYGKCQYAKLFNVLLNQNGLPLADFYKHYSTVDMYNFFHKHSDSFTILNSTVSLNRYSAPVVKKLETSTHEKCLKKLQQTTYFLLTCFESLHYIELRQCISFILDAVQTFLNSFSLIRQREMFDNFPETNMDKMGYLSLKSSNPTLPKSKNVRLIALIVCILAFEQTMHFMKIADEVSKRVSPEVSSLLCNISISEQFKFFRSLSDYFRIANDGYVVLLPSFIFPLCTFDTVPQSPQTDFELLRPTISPPNALKLPNNENSICKKSTNLVDNGLALLTRISPNYALRLKVSAIYLQIHFADHPPLFENILKSCLYVLIDVQACFNNLPYSEQQKFVNEFCQFLKQTCKKGIINEPSMPCVYNQEKVLLFVVYILIKEGKVHVENISSWMHASKVDKVFPTLNISGCIEYFKRMRQLVVVSVDGYLRLDQTFDCISCIINSHFNMLSGTSSISKNAAEVKRSDAAVSDKVEKDCQISLAVDKSSNTPTTDGCSTTRSIMPFHICKKIRHSLIYLCKLFDPVTARHFLETILHASSHVKEHFWNILSVPEQHKFIERFLKNINSDSTFTLYLTVSEVELSEDEKALLVITYLLIGKKSVYHRKIIQNLLDFGIKYKQSWETEKQQFRYFKTLDEYFIIGGTGYVSLNSTFSNISSIISTVSAFSTETENKLKSDVKIKLLHKNDTDTSIQHGEENKSIVNKTDQNIATPNIQVSDTFIINVSYIIIDISVSKLSVCEKMKIEKLCTHLSTLSVKHVQNYFSFHTVAEKKNFYANIPQYFQVSTDDFVSIKKDVISSYVPKTNIIIRDSKGRFVLNTASDLLISNGPNLVPSSNVTDISDVPASISSSSNNKLQKGVKKLKRLKSARTTQRCPVDPNALTSLQKSLELHNSNEANSNAKSEGNGITANSKSVEADLNDGKKSESENITKQCVSNVSPSIESYSPVSSISSPEYTSSDNLQSEIQDQSSIKFEIPRQPYVREIVATNHVSCTNSTDPVLEVASLKLPLTNCNQEKMPSDSSDPMCNNSNTSSVQVDAYTSYGLELLGSFFDDSFACGVGSSHVTSTEVQLCQTIQENASFLNIQNNRTPNTNPSKCDGHQKEVESPMPKCSNTVSHKGSCDFGSGAELKAVKFFCTILGSYDSGVTASFLMKHLNLASVEVKNFIMHSYDTNFVSFFRKYQQVFYVSPETENVYLVIKNK